MEGFNEQVVKRKNKSKQLMIKLLALVLLFAVPALCVVIGLMVKIPYLLMVAFFLFLGGIYGVWYTFSGQRVEFEYSVVGDYLHVSKIISLRKRKKMCNIPIKDIEILEIGDKTVREMSFSKVYMAAEDADDVNGNWFAVFSTPERGRCLLVFNPNEQILQGMKPYLKRELMLKLFYNRGENA